MYRLAVDMGAPFAAESPIRGPGWLLGSLIVVVGLAVVAALSYSWATRASEDRGGGVTRPMLALVLVGSLVLLAGASMDGGNEQTRNLLVGGIVASAASAVAFYFATRSAQEARRDILNAAFSTETVPDITNLDIARAQATMSRTSLVLKLPEVTPAAGATITKQEPVPGTSVAKGTEVKVLETQ